MTVARTPGWFRTRVTLLLLSAGTSCAATVFQITNPTFEDMTCGDGNDRNAEHQDYQYPDPSGWYGWAANAANGSAWGRWNPTSDQFPGAGDTLVNLSWTRGPIPAPADGFQYCFVRPGNDGQTHVLPTVWAVNTKRFCIQTNGVTATVGANQRYIATVAVGNPLDTGCPDYMIALCTEDTTSGNITAVLSSNTVSRAAIARGGFVDLSTTYTSPASGGPIGGMLALMITCFNFPETNGVSAVGAFDNVRLVANTVGVNDPPTATNLSAPETYSTNTALNLVDIVVGDSDSSNVTATLTLSTAAAGSLSTATAGGVTSTYDAGSGAWSASGALAAVNTLLAGVTYIPAAGYNANFSIATSVSDGTNAPLTGSKVVSVLITSGTVAIPVLNGDLETPVLADGAMTQPDFAQAARADPIGWDKMWVGQAGGANDVGTDDGGEGNHGIINAVDSAFPGTSGDNPGTLPAPAHGRQCMYIWPGDMVTPPAQTSDLLVTVYFWTDEQTDRTHGNGPPEIPVTITASGMTYTATVALGLPLDVVANGNTTFPTVTLGLMTNKTIGASGVMVATSTQTGGIAPGAWKDLSVSWTATHTGDGLSIWVICSGFTQLAGTRWGQNSACWDNVRLIASSTGAVINPPTAPAVSNGGATNLTSASARLTGTLTAGGSADIRVYWGAADGSTNPALWQHTNSLSNVSEGGFTSDIASLAPTNTYYYRCWATNAGGAAWADATAVFATLAASSATQTGSVISVNFTVGWGIGSDALAPSQAAGMVARSNWNNVVMTPNNNGGQSGPVAPNPQFDLSLVNDRGESSGALLSVKDEWGTQARGWYQNNYWCNGSSSGNDLMMATCLGGDEGLPANPSRAPVVRVKLPSAFAVGYDVYVYSSFGCGHTDSNIVEYGTAAGLTNGYGALDQAVFRAQRTVSIRESTYAPGGGFTEGAGGGAAGNCVVFRGMTNLDFAVAARSAVTPGGRCAINGIQIVALSATNANPGSAQAPGVSNGSGATNLTVASARLTGTLTGAESADVRIYWGTADGGTNAALWQHTNTLAAISAGPFNSDIAGLAASQTYAYRCCASNAGGAAWADATATFATPAAPVVTPPAADVYKMKIQFSGYSGRTEPLTNFPALVVFSNGVGNTDFSFTKYPFASSNGFDLRFYAGSATNALNYEIEQWADATLSAPTDLSGCILWLRADAGVQTNGSGAVTSWSDQSGHGNHAPAPAGNEPTLNSNALNGKPAVHFDGVNDCLWNTSWSPGFNASHQMTYFFVSKAGMNQDYAGFFGQRQSSGADDGNSQSLAIEQRRPATPGGLSYSYNWNPLLTVVRDNAFFRIDAFRDDGSAARAYLDGMLQGSGASVAGALAPSQYLIGARHWGNPQGLETFGLVDFAEIIIYTNALSATQMNQVGAYLSRKYGLATAYAPSRATVWVQVPELKPDGSTCIWAKWGDAGQAQQQACTTNGAAWDANYAAVWHFNSSLRDSTSNNNTGTGTGGLANVTGRVAGALGFNGSDAYVQAAASPSLDLSADGYTLEAWIYGNTYAGWRAIVSKRLSGGATHEWSYLMHVSEWTTTQLYQQFEENGQGDSRGITTANSVLAGRWHHVAATYDRSLASQNVKAFVDGAVRPDPTYNPRDIKLAVRTNGYPVLIGMWDNSRYFDGTIDELRLSKVGRSTNWVWATYMAAASNAVFTTYVMPPSGTALIFK